MNNLDKVGEGDFKQATPKVGRMYHIKGMYKGSFFRLLELGEKYAVLGYPSRKSKRLYATTIDNLVEIRKRSPTKNKLIDGGSK